jgi:hypothetical protein
LAAYRNERLSCIGQRDATSDFKLYSSFLFPRYLSDATQYYHSSPYLQPENFPTNGSTAGLAEGLAKAHEAYNVEGYVSMAIDSH